MGSDTGLAAEEHEIKRSAVGGNWGCLQTQINKLSALEGKAGAENPEILSSSSPLGTRPTSTWEGAGSG